MGRTLNTGTGVEVSVGDLIRVIADVMGQQVQVEEEQQRLRPEGSEVMRLVGDNSELRAATGWAPHFDLHAGLEATSQWFLEPRNLAHYRPDQYTI